MAKTMKVYKVQSAGVAKVVDAPVPALRPDYALVKVSAVALNPTDWKHIDSIPTEGATVGCDYAGTVVEVGDKVAKAFQKGDRIAGTAHGVNAVQPEDGTFGEYAIVKADVAIKIPDNLSDEDAATLGVSVTTCGQGLYQSLGLPLPGSSTGGQTQTGILIYGGSTATGLYALQYAKLSGLSPIIAVCSSKNFSLVKSYGATDTFDYKSSDAAKSIREFTKNSLLYAFDTISTKESAQFCADALTSESGANYSNLLSIGFPRKDVKAGFTLAYTAVGEAFEFRGGAKFAAKPEDFEFAKKFWSLSEKFFEDGKLKAPPVEVRNGGLEKISEGLDDLRQNRVSGTKLVYKI